jgi:hypothetical protein
VCDDEGWQENSYSRLRREKDVEHLSLTDRRFFYMPAGEHMTLDGHYTVAFPWGDDLL